MTDSSDERSTTLMLGEIRGQLRELIHTINNTVTKLDGMVEKIIKLDGVPKEVQNIKERLIQLETEKDRREGANRLLVLVLKSPMIAWLVTGIGTIWLIVTKRIH